MTRSFFICNVSTIYSIEVSMVDISLELYCIAFILHLHPNNTNVRTQNNTTFLLDFSNMTITFQKNVVIL